MNLLSCEPFSLAALASWQPLCASGRHGGVWMIDGVVMEGCLTTATMKLNGPGASVPSKPITQ